MRRDTLCRVAVFLAWMIPAGLRAQAPMLESCRPVSERTGVEGCWIVASKPLGKLPASAVFWTLDVFADHDEAQAAAGERGTVLDALDRVWVLTVGKAMPVRAGGRRVAQVGPLSTRPEEEYTAQYREAVMRPGAVSRTHLHAGPEAFYTETGETCLETPAGRQVSRPGHDVIVPEGEAMELTATGGQMRRGLVLVLYASSKPHTTLVTDWHATGLCRATR